jgi:lysylphosphatidylglycerol synthetase-like protein (DUF2156 family)
MSHNLLAATTTTTDLLDTAGTSYTGNAAETPNLIEIILSIVGVALSILGVIFLVLIIYAGYNYMIAGGDEGKVETAKQTITRAVIGLVIVLISFAIVQFVVPNLLCATGVNLACPVL